LFEFDMNGGVAWVCKMFFVGERVVIMGELINGNGDFFR
jgi:hypothetical protein